MNQNIRSQRESFVSTTIFADNGIGESRGTAVQTTTTKRHHFDLVKVNVAEVEAIPDGYVRINDLVADVENDAQGKKDLANARRWVQKAFYKGERTLRALRLNKGYSQVKLASEINSTQAQIARVENGDVDVQVSTLTRIAGALRLPPTKVFEAYINTRRAAGALQE